MLEMQYSGFGVNTMSADALAPKVASASADMVLAVWDRQHVLLFHIQFHLIKSSKIQDTTQNVNISFRIYTKIQHDNN